MRTVMPVRSVVARTVTTSSVLPTSNETGTTGSSLSKVVGRAVPGSREPSGMGFHPAPPFAAMFSSILSSTVNFSNTLR